MKYMLDIDEQIINEAVTENMVNNMVEQIERGMFSDASNRYSYLRKTYKENVQQEVRAMIKMHEPEIIEKAIAEAGAILARKAWKQKAEELT